MNFNMYHFDPVDIKIPVVIHFFSSIIEIEPNLFMAACLHVENKPI